jgi:hypothetical protein
MRNNLLLKISRWGIQYRIVTDGQEYRIEYKTFWLPFWRLHMEIYGTTFFIPTHRTISSAKEYIKHLKEKDLPEKWRPINE